MTQTSLLQKPAPLTPSDIEKLIAMRETLASAKKRFETMEAAVKSTEADILARIDAGADLSRCGYDVAVQTVERRYPAWKEEFISRLGKVQADAVLNGTVPTVYRKVVLK